MFFYRRLWKAAEADRRAADAAANEARQALLSVIEATSALFDVFENSTPQPEVRGLIRKLRHEVQHAETVIRR